MKHTMRRRWTVLILLLASFAGTGYSEAAGTEFPNRVINLVVPFPPGGGTDVVGRMIAEVMGEALRTKVIVVNKGGAAGVVGTQQVASAKPDGYTLLFTSQSIVTQTYETKGQVTHKQFILLGMLNQDAFGIAVARNAPWQTMQDFVKDARARPGQITMGTTGVGSITYMQIPLLEKAAGVKLQPVPYQGSAPFQMATVAGEVAAAGVVVGDAAALLKAGRLRLLGIMSAKRLEEFPDVPTYREVGVPVDFIFWRGLFVHKDTPQPIVEILRDAVGKVARAPAYKEMLAKGGYIPGDLVGEAELQEFLKREERIVEEVYKDIGVLEK